MRPTICIIGRANVGKSTLFNKLVGQRRSLVDDRPGVTRDRIFAEVKFNGIPLDLVDTGGLGFEPIDQIYGAVGQQIQQAARESDVLLFTLDAKSGLVAQDFEVMEFIRPLGKPIIGVVNKFDPQSKEYHQRDSLVSDFYRLGLDTLMPVSAEHGFGVPELIEEILKRLPDASGEEIIEEPGRVRLAFMGRPNVGKSSLINKILDEPRLIVSDQGGTTRDTVDMKLDFRGKPYTLLDTAGLRRRAKVKERIDVFSMIRSIKTIRQADVVALVLDGPENITHQDLRISNFISKFGSGLLILANKWDLCKDSKHERHEFREELLYRAPFLGFADIRFVSANSGLGIDGILPAARRIWKGFSDPIPHTLIKQVFENITTNMPGTVQPKGLKLRKFLHTPGRPCRFIIECNRPDLVTQDLERYLLNRFYESFDLPGIPIHLVFKR